MKRMCVTVGCRATVRHGRCAPCQQRADAEYNAARPWYRDPEYLANRAVLMATAKRCAICGGGPRPDDGWSVDHVIPAKRFVAEDRPVDNSRANLQVAHQSCNYRRGADEQPPPVEVMGDIYATRRSRRGGA